MKLTKPQKLIYDMEKFAGGSISVLCGSILLNGKTNLNKIKNVVNQIYRLNDALRIRIKESNNEISQVVYDYTEIDINVLHFENKSELDAYAESYAKEPLDFHGNLCECNIVELPQQYGLLVKLHHIIGDAWTFSLLGTQFNKLMNDEEIDTYSYTNYIESENKYLHSKRYEKDKAFFVEQFRRCDEVTYLKEKQSYTLNAKRKTFIISNDRKHQLEKYTEQHNSSPFMLFTTALSVYINRIKFNVDKFYIGTPVLNRINEKERNTAGVFINTVPMLIELNNTKSFTENLSVIEETAFSIFRHQKYNYGDHLSAIRKEYNFTEKLYDVIISYQNATVAGTCIETTWYHCGMQSESLQIHIDDRDNKGIYRVHYDYQTDKFTAEEIDKMHQHICNLLFDAIENDTKKLYELEILSDSEKQQILYNFNDIAVDYTKDKCVHQLFEEQVDKTPNKVAVIACDQTLTYAELNKQANQIAHSLIEKGVCVGDIVAFALPRRSYLIATMLGILKSGAAYLPIDPDYPQDRIEYMLSDSNAKLLITESSINELIANNKTTNPLTDVKSDNLCYCIYTSGSTGNPKGTLLKHKGIVNLVTNLDIYNDISNCERFGFTTTITFDVATQEIFTAFLNGFTGVLLSERKETKVDTIISDIMNNKVDIIYATPTYFSFLTNTKENAKKILSSLKVVCLAGEKFKLNEIVLSLRNDYEVNFENQYGPVELHVIATTKTIKDNDFATIGKPIKNNTAYIVDNYMQPTPIGVTGELCIAGDGVGAGYLNRPELTAEKFIDNPFGEGKLYKTGDLAYWREDGNIVYVGRNDFQVKIRGLRIELGEIENAICSIDGINQSVVVVRKNAEGRQLICAFYTGAEIDSKIIRDNIGKVLPKYMIPHIFTHITEMPLTSSGKINRKVLPEIDLCFVNLTKEYIAPITERETILVSTIETILGRDNVSITDNFFEIGGDSLKAIELVSKIESNGYQTDIKTIFECDTIKEIAQLLTVLRTTETTHKYTNCIPITDAQLRVYTAHNIHSDSTIYNIPFAFKVDEIDIERLQNAVSLLVERHEILRTYFTNIDGNVVQVVDESVSCNIEILNTNNNSKFVRPFDLSKSPLLRIGVYKNTIMIDMHHIIADGNSIPIFINELNELYMGRSFKKPAVQYREFVNKNQNYIKSEEYWLSVYSDKIPVLEINSDYHRSKDKKINGNTIFDKINIELHNKNLVFCKEQNITPYVFYMSAFYILLSKFSGSEDIVVGLPISGRNAKCLETIGMFVNTIALRNKPIGTKTVSEFLQDVKTSSIEAINHQNYPYNELVKKLSGNILEKKSLFDIMFAYQSEYMTDIIFSDKKVDLLPIPVTTSKYDFTFNIVPRKSDIAIMVEYNTDLFKEETINRLINSYKNILLQLPNLNNRLIKDISAISEVEKNKLLYDFNNMTISYPKDKCVHQLFEEQVDKTPNKVAVIACDQTLTYAELNKQANQIAHSLIEKGVYVGDIVAFALPRRSYLIATMLGILKSGAAYLPIDPDYPQDRIEYMLSDSNAKLLITESSINELIANNKTTNPLTDVKSDNLCYCIYTSGSTGQPKGTLLKHYNVVNYVDRNYFNNVAYNIIKNNYNRIASVTTVGFDIFVTESLLPLTNGLEILLANEQQAKLQTELKMLIETYPADVLQTTPTKMKSLISDKTQVNYLKTIKTIILGGEALDSTLVKKLEALTNAKIFNIYGPTETTVWSTNTEVTDSNDITIGKPIANTRIYIVDNYMQPTPIGVTGELCIAGDGVGAGYLNRAELTAEKFIDNPFGEGKLYKTGDLAYWREDGNIVYVGRNDFQVKIRGLRIELGEIENAICSIDGINQSVVVVRKNAEGRQLICAFYTGAEIDSKIIRDNIGKVLPKYMIPHIFTHITEMPLTSSGKINRKALPKINLENILNNTTYVAPKTNLEKELCKLFEQVLDVSPIGINDNFFDLGCDSLMAIEIVSKAHNEGVYFNLQNIFDYPTVKELCVCIENDDKQMISFDNVDFTKINDILEKNKIKYITKPKKCDVGNILIAGATGYLGIHILANFIDNDNGIAYCLVRGQDRDNSIQRLQELLDFYFGDKYTDMHRIEVICADLQKEKFGLTDTEYINLLNKVDTVINAAANVKHYGSYKYFYDVNVETTKRLIDFCKSCNARFIHTSTLSVSGNSFADDFGGKTNNDEKDFYESSLYIGQPLDNVYARSKFEAEKAVLDAMVDGLQANIMRMGNLTNRFSDGKFQKNYKSNAFLNRLKAVMDLNVFPEYLLNLYAEFTPVDEAAEAVMSITRCFNTTQTMFHINSTKVVYLDRLIEYFSNLGFKMKVLSEAEFAIILKQNENILESLINDIDENNRLNYDSNIHINNDFTVNYLKTLGFEWSDIDEKYMKKYAQYFLNNGYFKKMRCNNEQISVL